MSLSPFLSVISEDRKITDYLRLSDEFSPDSIKGYISGPKRKKKALKKMNNMISGRLISLCLGRDILHIVVYKYLSTACLRAFYFIEVCRVNFSNTAVTCYTYVDSFSYSSSILFYHRILSTVPCAPR